jgi:hypothetical protein
VPRRIGQKTRGKTAAQRLRRTDTYVGLDGSLRRSVPRYVDIGYGADATTVLETFDRLRPGHPALTIVGVEIDRERVENARPFGNGGSVDFVHGGFEAALEVGPAGVIRAMNVLRQYDERDHADAVAAMGAGLAPNGLLIEGTSSPSGRLLTANLYRHRSGSVAFDGLLMAPNPRRPWEPRDLQTVLPKNWIHRCEPDSHLDRLFGVFQRSVEFSRRAGLDSSGIARRAVADLDQAGFRCDRRPALLRRSLFVVLDPLGLEPPTTRT